MPVIQINGLNMNYVDEGQGDPLVLVHNLISSLRGYDFSIPVFSKYYRTIAYDIRGHGLSAKPKSGYSFDELSDDLYQLLKARNVDSCYLVGTAAVGRGIIFTFFLKHPEMVKALVAVASGSIGTGEESPGAGIDAGMSAAGAQIGELKRIARERGMLAALEARRRSMTFWTPRLMENPAIWSRFEEMYQQTSVDAFEALPERISPERRREIVAHVQSHPIPILQIVGAEDVEPGRVIANMKAFCPRLHGVILPESGHYPALENPDDFNQAVLNFLAGVRAYG